MNKPVVKVFPIVFFHGDKGGVGKSAACNAYADWAQQNGLPIAVVDGDLTNPDVGRVFDGNIPVLQANLRSHDGWMDMTDFVFANPERIILVSMPAGVGTDLAREAGMLATVQREQPERTLVLVWLVNRTLDSIALLQQAVEALGPMLSARIVLKNLFFGTADKFRRWDDSETRKAFEKAGGVTFPFAELHERTMDKLFSNPDTIMPFSAAVVPVKKIDTSPHKLTASEMVELNTWLAENDKTFRAMTEKMGLATK